MWEALGNAIKIFIEKHLIPSIVSIAAGITTVLILPDDNWMIVKIGQVWVGILAFAICFLVIKLLVLLAHGIKALFIKKANKEYDKKRNEEKEKEILEQLWSDVDALSPGDRKMLYVFIENENSPLEEDNGFHDYNSLFSSAWVVSTLVPYQMDNEEKPIGTNTYRVPITHFINQGKKQYKLTDDIYQLLKYSKEKYGKISHFE